jgi:hypothetical protein
MKTAPPALHATPVVPFWPEVVSAPLPARQTAFHVTTAVEAIYSQWRQWPWLNASGTR